MCVMSGVYVHIPFCKSRCKYCDFYSTTRLERERVYVSAVIEEWILRRQQWGPSVETIYIGGGTPSLLAVEDVQRLLAALPTANAREITLEANPGDITREKAQAWRAMGVNRLSIGIQSFSDDVLQLLGRRHTAEEAQEAVATARAAGFDNISADLIYAVDTEGLARNGWEVLKNDVRQLLQTGVEHISTYCLSYEEGTRMTQMLERGEIHEVDEDTENQMFDYIVTQLTEAGYEHYEVSNFARPHRRSQHNSNYWNDTPYIGLGAAAHSYDGVHRMWNVNDIDLYIKGALAHDLQRESETLTAEQHHTERVMLGLRTAEGIDRTEIDEAKALPYLQRGLLRIEGNRMVATTQGYHILNRIIEDLI